MLFVAADGGDVDNGEVGWRTRDCCCCCCCCFSDDAGISAVASSSAAFAAVSATSTSMSCCDGGASTNDASPLATAFRMAASDAAMPVLLPPSCTVSFSPLLSPRAVIELSTCTVFSSSRALRKSAWIRRGSRSVRSCSGRRAPTTASAASHVAAPSTSCARSTKSCAHIASMTGPQPAPLRRRA